MGHGGQEAGLDLGGIVHAGRHAPARVVLQDFTGVPCWSTWPPCATWW
jgi:hypothetical protein